MAVSDEMQNTGDPNMQAEVRAVVEHVLAVAVVGGAREHGPFPPIPE